MKKALSAVLLSLMLSGSLAVLPSLACSDPPCPPPAPTPPRGDLVPPAPSRE